MRLRAGENRLLVKVCNRDSDWRFNLRITDEEGVSLVTGSEGGAVRLRTAEAGAPGRETSPGPANP